MNEAEPRISVMKLAEFAEARVSRQERILRDQMRRTGFKARRHRSTRAALVRFLQGGPLALKDLLAHLDAVRASVPEDAWDKQDRLNAIEAIETFLQFFGNIDLADGTSRQGRAGGQLLLGGTWVSIAPDLVVWRRGEVGRYSVGSLKLHLGKTKRLTARGAAVVTSLQCLHLARRFAGTQHRVEPDLCQVVDVFGRGTFKSSPDYQQLIPEIEGYCADVRRMWDRLRATDTDWQMQLAPPPL